MIEAYICLQHKVFVQRVIYYQSDYYDAIVQLFDFFTSANSCCLLIIFTVVLFYYFDHIYFTDVFVVIEYFISESCDRL